MKKLTKFLSLLMAVAMVLSMAACTGTTDPTTTGSNPSTQPSTTSKPADNKGSYVVKVMSVGGLPLEGVNVMIYDGDNMVQAGSTATDGSYTVQMKTGKTYTVKLGALPAGYTAEESYSFTGNVCQISLNSSLITGESLSGKTFKLGDIMYDFEFTDSEGVTHKLSETLAEKKMVMLNFWYSDCSWCYKEFPAINAVYGDFSEDIAIWALDDYPGETLDDVNSWKSSLELAFPMGLIKNGLGIGSFGGGGWPMTVIIDRYGVVSLAHAGAITSEYTWKQLFSHFTAADYNTVLIENPDDFIEVLPPTYEFPGHDAVNNAITNGDIQINYYASSEETDGEGWEYIWPFIEAEYNGQSCVKASNNRIDSSYAILYMDVELKAGQALGFDYIISCELGIDGAVIIVNGEDIYQMSGVDENPQWKTCYPCVAEEDGTYQVAIVYMKDGSTNDGDDTIYVDNVRVVEQKDIDVDTFIPRQAAVEQADGSFQYAEIVYNEEDGYYHVGSVNGPLLLANLMGYSQFCKDDYIYNMAVSGQIVKDGHDYKDDLTPYANYASNSLLNGYCTVNYELAELLKIVAEIKGFDTSDKNEWLQICEYYQAYGPSGNQLSDPIEGLAPFSAPEAILGKWVDDGNGNLVFQGANGETGDYNRFYYDRPIIPRGKFYRFTPEVSGAYRFTSHTDSSSCPDAWIFTEEGFYNRDPLYTYAAEERIYNIDGNNISMVYYMEAGKDYFIDIAFWDVYETGYIPFDVEFLGETYDMFRLASPGVFTYIEGTEFIVSGGIEVELGEDGIYYHVKTDKDGNKVRGSKLYADFTMLTPIFSSSLERMIEMGAFNFALNEYDQEIVTYLKNRNNDVEATREYLKQMWGADYEAYAEAYKLEEIFQGTYHGTGVDKTEEARAFLAQIIDAEGSPEDGCVVVTAELAELLQMLMDKFTFEGVEYSWCKLCYYFDYMGR